MKVDLRFQEKYDCNLCQTRCDGRSKSEYVFKDDVALSEEAEDWVLNQLATTMKLTVKKTVAEAHGIPDIEILEDDSVIGRVEVKAQGRTFMSVRRLLPESSLLPYETVALNLSDLQRYIHIKSTDKLHLFIVWRVRRPCLGEGYWGNEIGNLEEILMNIGSKRRFRRASTPSDYNDGIHKGVTVNYHFSLKELYHFEIMTVKIHNYLSL